MMTTRELTRFLMLRMKVCLVGSSGGHLTHLYMLKPFWKDKNRFWVTFDKEDARSLLEGEKVYPCYFPTNRSIKALIKNTKIAWDVLHKEKPDLIISCGAAVAVPFFYIGKMMGAKLVYIEVFDRIDADGNMSKEEFIRQRDAYRVQEDDKMEQIQRLRTEKNQIFQPVKKDTDNLQAVMNTVGEAGDVMHLSQNVVETFIDRIEVFNNERVKIRFTFEDVLKSYETG